MRIFNEARSPSSNTSTRFYENSFIPNIYTREIRITETNMGNCIQYGQIWANMGNPIKSIDQAHCNKPTTFINRPFGGSTFPAYMSKEEYERKCLSSQFFFLPSYYDNGGIYIDQSPADPPYGLYRINVAGKMVQVM